MTVEAEDFKYGAAFEQQMREADSLDAAPGTYMPNVQTFLSPPETPSFISPPPATTTGVRYAIAQGPSVVPGDEFTHSISAAINFNLSTLEIAAAQAFAYKAQLLTLPELFLSGYEFGNATSQSSPSVAVVKATAQYIAAQNLDKESGGVSAIALRYGITIVCPMPVATTDPAGNAGIFDMAIVFGPDGSVLGRQFKTHLWGLAEREWFSFPYFPATTMPVTEGPTLPHDDKSPYAPFYVNEFPVGVGICYDAEFPEVARAQALNGSLLTVFPTAAPNSILPGQTEAYPDISLHYIPASALQNSNFCSYSNRAGKEYSVTYDSAANTYTYTDVLQYTGNSIICSPYGKAMVKAMANQHTILIADCVYSDYPPTQPADTNYLINRRPELAGYLTNKTVSFPFGKTYTYPANPPQHTDPQPPAKNENSCG